MAKNPKVAVAVDPKKQPKAARTPQTPENLTWSFSMLDDTGPFGWHRCDSHEMYLEILKKKKNFESMTFTDLRQGGSHSVEVWKLCKDAQDRLADLNLDDLEELYSFRLTGTNRLWCIRHASIMRVLWWDPEHQVCPSGKRHT